MAKSRQTLLGATVRSITMCALSLMLMILPLSSSLPIVSAEDCVPPADTGSGVHRPVGADAAMFIYNCNSGLWESAHFIYNPATGETTASDPAIYTYNNATGNYDVTLWAFHAPSGDYISYTQSVVSPPAGVSVVGGPPPPASVPASSITNTGQNSNNEITNDGGVTDGSSIHNTGPSSNNTIDGTANNNEILNSKTTATITNDINTSASTGNAIVLSNTSGGSARSGNSDGIANVVNMLQSASNALGGDAVTFVASIDGDVNGDIMLDPNMLSTIQPAANNQTGNNNLTMNNEVTATMNNTIDLSAETGDATVAENTKAGDADTGTARTIANVVNVIQSAISSGKSFLGIININGNLNGDILLPPDFIDQLIAANVPTVDIIADTGPNSNNSITNTKGSNNTTVTNTNNQGITNNVDLSADTGLASVNNNTSAGNATSGNATTTITAFNLTGSQVIGSNALLVFVNVSGEWVGLIVNAPAGATAAALGGGLTKSSSSAANNTTDITNKGDYTINNNIKLASQSGDATVRDNTEAGNARSGDASSSLNLLNIQNSSLSLSNWLGILFINVFGSWHGSFGINTSAGDMIAANVTPGGTNTGGLLAFNPTVPSVAAAATSGLPTFVAFSPTGSNGSAENNANMTTASGATEIQAVAVSEHLPPQTFKDIMADKNHMNWLLIAASILTFISFSVGNTLYAVRTRHQS